MVKKLLALVFGLTLAIGAMAQSSNPVVPQDNILFWTGKGSHKAVVAITWNDATVGNIGFAWGVRWNGDNVTSGSLMDTIAAYDSRFNVTYSSPSWLDNITYNDTELGLNLVGTAGWWWYNWKNSADVDYQSSGVAADMVQNGDFVDWMQTGVADTMIMASDPNAPVDPMPEDAEIAASDIIYWVGEGNNKVVFAINWADTALAWGYQFSTDSVYVSEIIDALVAADPRLSIEGTSSFVSDFRYADENITDTLTITPHAADDYSIYFNMQVNHVSSTVGAAGHAVVNGDFVKFADTYVAVKADSTWISDWSYWDYTYVWPMEIHPVSVPQSQGITVAEGMSLSIYPNPAVSSIKVSFNALENASDIVLFDMTGRRVAVIAAAAGCTEVQISVDGLANGVYLLRMGDSAAKVIVRK
jgi:hypothetical protein